MTIKEEDFLIQNFGKDRHFSVPEGYFEKFCSGIMEQTVERKAAVVPMRPRSVWRTAVSVAACLAAVVVMAGAYFHADGILTDAPSEETTAQAGSASDAVEQAADYMMLDETDLYAYMSDY